MANSRIGPSPGPVNSNIGHFCIEGNAQGMTYDGTLCTGEVFVVDQDTGVCSRWDGSTLFPRGVTLQKPNLIDANGAPVTLGGAPADGQPISFCEFGIVGIKSACNDDDIMGGYPYKGSANGQVIQLADADLADATGAAEMVCRLLDFQDKNAGGGAFAWFFWFGWFPNTNKTA